MPYDTRPSASRKVLNASASTMSMAWAPRGSVGLTSTGMGSASLFHALVELVVERQVAPRASTFDQSVEASPVAAATEFASLAVLFDAAGLLRGEHVGGGGANVLCQLVCLHGQSILASEHACNFCATLVDEGIMKPEHDAA